MLIFVPSLPLLHFYHVCFLCDPNCVCSPLIKEWQWNESDTFGNVIVGKCLVADGRWSFCMWPFWATCVCGSCEFWGMVVSARWQSLGLCQQQVWSGSRCTVKLWRNSGKMLQSRDLCWRLQGGGRGGVSKKKDSAFLFISKLPDSRETCSDAFW